jgi:hypothetical protein
MVAHAHLGWGYPAYIVVGKDAPREELFAAQEFQRLYKLRSGQELPIVNEERGEHGVYIGRAALNVERKPRQGTNPDGTHWTSGIPQKWEATVEKRLKRNLDAISPSEAIYCISGLSSTCAVLIVGGSPESTLESVYDCCEQNLGVKRDTDAETAATLHPFRGWSISDFIEKPESEWQRKKRANADQSVSAAVSSVPTSESKSKDSE